MPTRRYALQRLRQALQCFALPQLSCALAWPGPALLGLRFDSLCYRLAARCRASRCRRVALLLSALPPRGPALPCPAFAMRRFAQPLLRWAMPCPCSAPPSTAVPLLSCAVLCLRCAWLCPTLPRQSFATLRLCGVRRSASAARAPSTRCRLGRGRRSSTGQSHGRRHTRPAPATAPRLLWPCGRW